MRQFFYFISLILFISLQTTAQNVFADYQDGKLYVKLKSHYNFKTGAATVPNYTFDLNNLPFYYKLDPKFGITHLGRAFQMEGGEKLNNTMVLEFSNPGLVEELIRVLKIDPFVEYAEKVPIDRLHLTPNDPQLVSQWHLTKINAIAGWNFASAGSNIVIAIVDDAIQRNHPDLSPNIWVNTGEIPGNGIDDDGNGFIDDINGWDVAGGTNQVDPPSNEFDHGTHVAGIASAATDNGIGIASVGFSCKIMCIKATNNPNTISAGYAGILYAANNGAHVINMSWGGSGASITNENIINYAISKGCILVASAGNDNNTTLLYPAAYPGVISVASTNANDEKSEFSNYGAWVKISAPGSSILSTTVNSTYGNKSGTSMASPMVAGLVGLMKFLNPTMPNQDLIQCLYNSADVLSSFPGQMGAGRINADKAMACISNSLNLPPIPDFIANATEVVAGGLVTFTDQSSYTPTSWQWTFDGGSPAVFNGKNPPAVRYNNPGLYTVSLTVSNAFGGPVTKTKTNYIKVNEAPTCLTVNLPIPNNWQVVNYSSGAGFVNGHVNGLNSSGDRQKAMFFNLFGTPHTSLTSVNIRFGAAFSTNPQKAVVVRVLDGTTGQPGAILGSHTLTMSQIMSDVSNGRSTIINFSAGNIPLPTFKQFFVAVDFSSLTWEPGSFTTDSLSIFSNVEGQTVGTPIWSMGSNGVWRRYGTVGTWDITNASLLIHPFVTPNGAKSVINPKNPVICSGNTVEFSAAGSTFGDLLQWQFPGAAPPQAINNQMVVNPLYPTQGSFKAYLLTRGGCQEIRADSAVVTVNQSPQISISASKNPICVGESATLTATGANTYSWSPATGLNTITGAVVIANPNQRVSYSISGTTGACTSVVPFELFVNARTADVALTASVTNIEGPTTVTFTAIPVNGGQNPQFSFYVNNIPLQTGPSSVFISNVSPGSKIKCSLTSSEPCVDEKTVLSNEITMGNALPVILLHFNGRRTPAGNLLEWTTGIEINSKEFILERSSDGANFGTIDRVNAAGNSGVQTNYSLLDGKFGIGKNFYRLKMVDLDGTFKYSKIVLIENGPGMVTATLSPNPSRSGSSSLLTVTGIETDARLSITLINAAGAHLRVYQVHSFNGIAQFSFPSENLPSGTYFIHINDGLGNVNKVVRWNVLR